MSLPPNDERPSFPDERLVRAYRNADYRVNGTVLKIDEPHPDFDRHLASAGAEYYTFLTAYNPRSTPLPPVVNEARHQQLLQLLAGRNLRFLPASGSDPANDWEEEIGVCLLDPPPEEALEIGRLFEQHAVVEGRRGGPARLRWL